MKSRTWFFAAVALAAAGTAGVAVQRQRHSQKSEERQLIREFPDVLVYQGFGLLHGGDIEGAVAAWERYLQAAPPGADTVSIRELIEEARAMPAPPPAGP